MAKNIDLSLYTSEGMILLTELITKHNLNCYMEKNYRSSSGNIWNGKEILFLNICN